MSSTVTHLMKSLVSNSSVAAHLYSRVQVSRANWNRHAGHPYTALRNLCEAHRRISTATRSEAHLRKILQVYREKCYADGSLNAHSENGLYKDFVNSAEAQAIRTSFSSESVGNRVRLRHSRNDGDVGRQGNMMILKAPDKGTGEKGAIIVKYNDTFAQLAALFNLSELLRRYRIVLEPSYSRNFEPSLFLYCGADSEVLLTSRCSADHEFIHRVGLNFESVVLGASDWVDPDLFVPLSQSDRDYDVVMVASWMRLKRHNLLFEALATLSPKRLRVALVGYPMDLSRIDVERMMRHFGVEKQCDIFENIAPDQVANIVGRSKVAVHLSKQEGTNKATFEALCCDTPLVVYRHNIGFPMEAINSRTGILADDHELPYAVEWMVKNYRRFSPRDWVLARTGCVNATRCLNDALRQCAIEKGEPWSRDIVPRVNRTNARYKCDNDRMAMDIHYDELSECLLC